MKDKILKEPNLTVVTGKAAQQPAAKGTVWKTFKDEMDNWKLYRCDIRQRVKALREELEDYKLQLDAGAFNIASGSMQAPWSLDGGERKYTVELVENLNPCVEGLYEKIDEYAKHHGCHDNHDFNADLFELKMYASETGFQIGMLAGVIMSGASQAVVDRFERALMYAAQSEHWRVKD